MIRKKRISKPRTATWHKINQILEWMGCRGGRCLYFDGFQSDGYPITECIMPGKIIQRCTGNYFDCIKEQHKFLAIFSEKAKKKFIEKWNL